jgi:cytochrome b
MKTNAHGLPSGQIQVWDLAVRLFHWSLVGTVILAYLVIDPRQIHRTLGYIVIGLIAFRLIWGGIGTRHARFANFVPGPRRLMAYLRDLLNGRETRYLGHNPAGSAMVLMLLATLGAVGATGYMMGMDAYFGQSWVEHTHELFVDILFFLIICHVAGVIYASWRHKENLVKSMLTGKKDIHERPAPR